MNAGVAVARWSADEIAERIGATREGDGSAPVRAVTTDSRVAHEGEIFFALPGASVRGVDFVPDAFGSGCSVVVVPKEWTGSAPAGSAVLRHDDPLAALARFARSVRREWTCPVLAVTGSVGKTSVKEMTAHVLGVRYRVSHSPGNFNTIVGLARTILAIDEPPEILVLEVGASAPGEIAVLAKIVEPTAAALTNIAPAHLAGFRDLESVAREKSSLLATVPAEGWCLVDGDEPLLRELASGLAGRVRHVGFGADCDIRVLQVEELPGDGVRYRLADGTAGTIPQPGRHQVKNALFALAFGEIHGVPCAEGAARLAAFAGVPGRLSVSEHDGVLVVDDTYNANPRSLRAALDWFAGVEVAGRKALVLGDMLELGGESARFHVEAGRWCADTDAELVVFVGEESRVACEEGTRRSGDHRRFRHVPDSEEAARLLATWVRRGDAVLVKGSRGMRMERVVQRLVAGGKRADAL
jgi:UDP-N-acetylmuramoyl-tripeptide--D-alanyl-D-alanine ligase